ncbi:hypothetical protein JYU34_005471 [Plutella xylostella]|uniref:Uncharacterized protein n=1 Tax=Plutella xylostella TaxID=51655 RepID=A0ABQ7QWT1_PLUXY|nr:hypothetical protein JYU34_005471 [Plutella xylostella]
MMRGGCVGWCVFFFCLLVSGGNADLSEDLKKSADSKNSALESDNDVLGQGGLSPAAEKENIIDPKDVIKPAFSAASENYPDPGTLTDTGSESTLPQALPSKPRSSPSLTLPDGSYTSPSEPGASESQNALPLKFPAGNLGSVNSSTYQNLLQPSMLGAQEPERENSLSSQNQEAISSRRSQFHSQSQSQSRRVHTSEYILPESMVYGTVGTSTIVCSHIGELFYYSSSTVDCSVCACVGDHDKLKPICASCGGCMQPVTPSIEVTTTPAPAIIPPPISDPVKCEPYLPINEQFQNPFNPCQLCICREVLTQLGQLDVDIVCDQNPQCVLSPEITTLQPSSPAPPHQILPNVTTPQYPEPPPPTTEPPTPTPPIRPIIIGPLPGPSPHESCSPYIPNVTFDHPWDPCKECVCTESRSYDKTTVEVDCVTKEECCVIPGTDAIKPSLEPGVMPGTDATPPSFGPGLTGVPVDEMCGEKQLGVEFPHLRDPCLECSCNLYGSYIAPVCKKANRPECNFPVQNPQITSEKPQFLDQRCINQVPNIIFADGCKVCICQVVFKYVTSKCKLQPNCVPPYLPTFGQSNSVGLIEPIYNFSPLNALIDSYKPSLNRPQNPPSNVYPTSNVVYPGPPYEYKPPQPSPGSGQQMPTYYPSAYPNQYQGDYPNGLQPGRFEYQSGLQKSKPHLNSQPRHKNQNRNAEVNAVLPEGSPSKQQDPSQISTYQLPPRLYKNPSSSDQGATTPATHTTSGVDGVYNLGSTQKPKNNLPSSPNVPVKIGRTNPESEGKGVGGRESTIPSRKKDLPNSPLIPESSNSSTAPSGPFIRSGQRCQYDGDKYHEGCEACFCRRNATGSLYSVCYGDSCV